MQVRNFAPLVDMLTACAGRYQLPIPISRLLVRRLLSPVGELYELKLPVATLVHQANSEITNSFMRVRVTAHLSQNGD
jgi:hypothetical protein